MLHTAQGKAGQGRYLTSSLLIPSEPTADVGSLHRL